jgi:S1-C subfamily serine protease
MRSGRRLSLILLLAALAGALLIPGGVGAGAETRPPLPVQAPEPPTQNSLDELLSAVVRLKASVHPDARTAETLGRERDGSGIVIDSNGLILTIGYLMVEAHAAQVILTGGRVVPAEVVGYDHDTGFGLLRATEPLKVKPMTIGKAADLKERDQVLAASFGGRDGVAPAVVVSRRPFVGTWEYLVDGAIFTAPAHSHWSGAALISREGKLVGVGSLVVADALGTGGGMAGNMYVPIDLLPPILADLIADGRAGGPPRPWIGLSTNELSGALVVARVTPGGPAEKAGVERGAVILGVGGEKPKDLADFYRKVWAVGRAGATVPLDVAQGGKTQRIEIQSINRMDHLRLKSTY